MLASSDPLNFILATIWSTVLIACIALTWYSYILWRRWPNESISNRIAEWSLANQDKFRLAFLIGMMIGYAFGVIGWFFAGHWFWPTEIIR